jgi:hypothetical protein
VNASTIHVDSWSGKDFASCYGVNLADSVVGVGLGVFPQAGKSCAAIRVIPGQGKALASCYG